MKLQRIHINNFGKLNNLTLSFGSGIHVISGANESGKTTLHAFLKAMLFGIERRRGRSARNDPYNHYNPWNGGNYGGVLELEKDEVLYSIYRSFDKGPHPCRLADETHARELTPSAENFAVLMGGLTPSLYDNTLSVGQLKAETDEGLADELKNHIINLHTSGSASLDVSGAIQKLKLEKKRVESGFSREADMEESELSLRISAMEEDLAQGSVSQATAKLESEKAALDRRILRLGNQHQQLAGTIAHGEDTLKKHHIGRAEDVREMLDEVDELTEECHFYKKHYGSPIKGILRPLFAVVALLLTLAGIFAFWQSSLHLVQGSYLKALIFVLVTILTLTFAVRLNRRRDAAAIYREDMEALEDIYEEHFNELPEEITETDITRLRSHLAGYLNLMDEISRSRAEITRTVDELMKAQTELSELTSRLDKFRKENWQLEQKEEALRALQERREMLRAAVDKNRAIEEEVLAIQLAMDTMQELSTRVFDSLGYCLEESASQILEGITDGAYSRIHIDDSLGITLEYNHTPILLHQVSSGTLDQIYLALRLACIEFLWPDQAMPLFLDDSFALYDNKRLEATLQWLSENYSGQIFLFTCHDREVSILNRLQIPYQHIAL